jgi:geranylgeranyl pyrophosphate synthase
VSPSESLDAFLGRARLLIDEALERYLPRPPACPALISEAMRYSVFAGGKRLRPSLTLAAADAVARSQPALRQAQGIPSLSRDQELSDNEAASDVGPSTAHPGPIGSQLVSTPPAPALVEAGSKAERLAQDRLVDGRVLRAGFSPAVGFALPAACAIELMHTYSLIHDDLPAMDNDTLRRGRPTLHVVYGDGVAILTGDGLQAEAFALLAREPIGDDQELVARKLRVLRVVGDAASSIGLVGGQAIDLQAAGQAPGHSITLDADGLRAMHARKTGALIRASAVSGAIMGGGDERAIGAVDQYAAELGLAFQIVDDILDVEGSADDLGKTIGKDACDAKPTYPSLYGLDRSRSLAADCIDRARQTLEDARLTDGWLSAIADWVVSRKN